MNENNDKSQTLEFKPVREEKERVDRSSEDVYSSKRRNESYKQEPKGSDKKLVIIAIVLSVLLIIAIIAGAIIISSENKKVENDPPVAVLEEEEIPEEEPEPEKDIILVYNIVFYGESVMEKDGQYTIFADLLNNAFEKEDNRKLIINDETDIRENGKRISKDGLVYLIESMVGEQIVFEGEIRDKDNVLLSVSFDGSFREELNQQEETEEENEETPKEEKPEENQLPPETVENTDTEAITIN